MLCRRQWVAERVCASAFQLFNKRSPLFCDFKRAGSLAALQSQTQTELLKGPIVDTRADFFKLSSKKIPQKITAE